jgi:hypothetical protein
LAAFRTTPVTVRKVDDEFDGGIADKPPTACDLPSGVAIPLKSTTRRNFEKNRSGDNRATLAIETIVEGEG